LSDPQFKDERGGLKTFDYVVANPPFSYDKWTYGFHPEEDIFRRFDGFGIPPLKNGDYAFLLHIVASLKPNGKAAVILPHGVLFRGNAEGEIRKNLIQRGLIKAVIGLPANLFYGTGIPACVIVIDKEGANSREEVFFVNAASGYAKDGAKNRLRERDIRKIVDVFKDRQQIPGFSKAVPVEEISNEKNSFNLNIPRYIDSKEQQDIQDIEAHLKGGIPLRDIEGLNDYWLAFPTLKVDLFEELRPGYLQSKVSNSELRQFILEHSDLVAFRSLLKNTLKSWENFAEQHMMSFEVGASPREMLVALSDELKSRFNGVPLIDGYAMFQHLMDYWNSTLQDDLYIITQDGWRAIPYRIQETKKGKSVDKGWACDLIPKSLIVERYFKMQSDELASLEIELESLESELESFIEEQNQEGGVFFTTEKVNKASANKLLKELKGIPDTEVEVALVNDYLKMVIKQAELKSKIKNTAASLDLLALSKYNGLSEVDVKELVIREKWFRALEFKLDTEMVLLQTSLSVRLTEITELYQTTLGSISTEVHKMETLVNSHLSKFWSN
jgi:type I restriction enzyme M protein